MKLLVTTNMYPSKKYPAYGSFVQQVVRGLEEYQGVECQVISISERKTGFRTNLLKYLKLSFNILKAGLFQKYDGINAHYIVPTGLLSLPAALFRGKPLVVTAHGGDVRLGQSGGGARSLTRLVLGRAHRVVAVSRYLAREIEREFSVPPGKIAVINCGVDTRKFTPLPREETRQQLGIPPGRQAILFVGNLIELKGLLPLLQAFASLAPAFPRAHLYLVGEGPLGARLREEAARLGLADRVTFTGPLPHSQVPRWMAAAHLFVLPSFAEGFGLVALEALACGTPVVASRVGGLPEVVTPGRDGFLVPPGDAAALQEKITRLLQDPDLCREFSLHARESALQHDLEAQVEKLVNLFK